jgi:guanylate kinase
VTPRVVVLASPSGGGKTTIARTILERCPTKFGYSVSATTRRPRLDEKEGEAYHFLTREEFADWRQQGRFVETAEYAGEWYGTLKSEVEKVLASGRHVLLDIEVVGAQQVRQTYPNAVMIFILPSSPRVLVERLLQRKSESPAALLKRLERAMYEVRATAIFDRVVKNDVLEDAVNEVIRIVDEGGGSRREKGHIEWFETFAFGLQAERQRLYDELHGG